MPLTTKPLLRASAITGLFVLACSCGQKGPLKHPDGTATVIETPKKNPDTAKDKQS